MFFDGAITSTSGTLPSGVTPAKSFTTSNVTFGCTAGAMVSALEWTRMVYPSGSALATAEAPMVPPPPVRFSTTTVCPICAETRSKTTRGMTSVALPADSGTITLIGCRVGQTCAWAGAAAAIIDTQAATNPRVAHQVAHQVARRFAHPRAIRHTPVIASRRPFVVPARAGGTTER